MALSGNKNFSDYDNYVTDPNPTTSAQAQDYFRNQATLLKAVIDCDFWQPETVYQPGDIVKSDSMPNGTEAVMVATKASVTSNVEPQWGAVGGANISDGACFWKLRWQHWGKTEEQARNNLDLRIQTFTSTSELGLTNNATELEILNAMPVHSVFQCAVTKTSFPNLFLWNHTSSNTRLRLTRTDNNSFILEAFVIHIGTTIFMSVSNTSRTSVEYIKVADGNGYLPLTGGELTGQVRVNKGSDWGQFVAYSASGYYRAFEANDGAIRLDVRNNKDTTNRRFLDIRNSLGMSDVTSAILLHDTVDGVDKLYKIFGEHNIADKIIDSYGDDYIRFSDGTQICYCETEPIDTINAYAFADYSWTFPVPFVKKPIIVPQHATSHNGYAHIMITSVSRTNTGAIIRFFNNHSHNNYTGFVAAVIAIGKWK